ncbi:MAG: SAM-dependent methyltransferase [bacterium]|nr:SAM-dependent methyltransferase [Gammaproteobacteria bacterium]HIL97602.1 SAM-dependent methyltransferase [Pseudomonadales bacterium]
MKKFKIACLGVLLAAVASGCAQTDVSKKGVDPVALANALQSGDRAEADMKRDAGRKPAEVIAFLGIEEGMSVIDLIAAGGYYTEVLSNAVGSSGTVYAQNPAAVLKFRDGANDKAMSARLADNRLANVKRWDREFTDLGIEAGSLDAALTALNLHDVYNNSPEAAYGALMTVTATLKSGGILGIIDHSGNPDADNAKLHRMQKSQAVELAEKLGFKVESSELLSNSSDDKTQMVFAPGVRGSTDRFLLKLTKP